MKEQDRITKLLAKLLQQTQEGTLVWEAGKPPRDLTFGTEDVADTVFISEKKGRILRLFPYKTKFYTDEEEYHWEDGVALDISDEKESSWWRFPQNPIILDLLEAVKFNTVDVEGFINGLLSEED